MSYLALVTFDLHEASSEDYKTAYADLAKLGFSTHITGSTGNRIPLPNTTCTGEFTGTSSADIRDTLTVRVREAFANRGFVAKIFITVGDSWAWSYRTTT